MKSKKAESKFKVGDRVRIDSDSNEFEVAHGYKTGIGKYNLAEFKELYGSNSMKNVRGVVLGATMSSLGERQIKDMMLIQWFGSKHTTGESIKGKYSGGFRVCEGMNNRDFCIECEHRFICWTTSRGNVNGKGNV